MSHTSLHSQITNALHSLLKLGEKRYQYKKRGVAHLWIFYHQTYKKYARDCWSIIKQVQEVHGVNLLIKIKPRMIREEFARRIKVGQSPWTLWAYRSALIKLERGIENLYGYKVRLVPRDMKLPPRRVKLRRDRFAYTPEETKEIIQAAYYKRLPAATVLDVIAHFGLRLKETLRLRVKDVREDVLVVFKGKGGKRREVPMVALELIEKLSRGKENAELIFPGITERMVRYCMEKACASVGITVHKVHNLRHQYAVRRYTILRKTGASDKGARLVTMEEMGHGRISVSYTYAPPMVRPGWRRNE